MAPAPKVGDKRKREERDANEHNGGSIFTGGRTILRLQASSAYRVMATSQALRRQEWDSHSRKERLEIRRELAKVLALVAQAVQQLVRRLGTARVLLDGVDRNLELLSVLAFAHIWWTYVDGGGTVVGAVGGDVVKDDDAAGHDRQAELHRLWVGHPASRETTTKATQLTFLL